MRGKDSPCVRRPWGSPTSHPTLSSTACRRIGIDRHNKETLRTHLLFYASTDHASGLNDKQACCRLHGPRPVVDYTATSRLLRLPGVHDLAQQLRIFDRIHSSALSKAIRAELVRLYDVRQAAISAPGQGVDLCQMFRVASGPHGSCGKPNMRSGCP